MFSKNPNTDSRTHETCTRSLCDANHLIQNIGKSHRTSIGLKTPSSEYLTPHKISACPKHRFQNFWNSHWISA
jgi:hypothetical protein